jgi:hypothetical protein
MINPRAWLTAAGVVLIVSSVPVSFEWGAMQAFLIGVLGLVLVLVRQTRPRQRGGRRWH